MAVAKYDYSKLRGRIVEVFGTQKEFAKAFGKTPQTISCKLSGLAEFTQDDITTIVDLLHINPSEIHIYFFTKNVENNSTFEEEGR